MKQNLCVRIDRLFRLIDWKIAVMAAVAAPLVVLLHEHAHVFALEIGGIDARLYGFSMAMPVGYSWNFEGLEQACVFYNASPSSVAYAALAGPIMTLLIAYGALIAYHFKKAKVLWACAFSAVVLRTAGIMENLPRFLDGTINTTDEAIAAHFLNFLFSLAIGFQYPPSDEPTVTHYTAPPAWIPQRLNTGLQLHHPGV